MVKINEYFIAVINNHGGMVIFVGVVFVFVVLKFFNVHKKTIFAISLPLFLFIKLSKDLIKNELSVFDNVIYRYISKSITYNMTDFMKFISHLGSWQVLVIVTTVIFILTWKNKEKSFYYQMIGANFIGSSIANEIFKQIFHRARPNILQLTEISGFSFPSGHSMVGLSFYGFICYLCFENIESKWRNAVVVLFSMLILFIGISRIYLGVHYASDVVAGFSAGLVWLSAFITILKISRS